MARQATKPRVLSIKDFTFNGIDRYDPECRHTDIVDAEGFGGFGLYFMPPGYQTDVFSLESEDDGTADEYYGPRFEFYYLLAGEITMYWGKDAESLRRGEGERLLLGAGDFGCWEREWKFSVKNSGAVPAMFFWGLAEAPPGVKERWPVLQTRQAAANAGPEYWINLQSAHDLARSRPATPGEPLKVAS